MFRKNRKELLHHEVITAMRDCVKMTAEVLLLARTVSNDNTGLRASIQSLQAQLNTITGQFQAHEQLQDHTPYRTHIADSTLIGKGEN